MTQAMLWQTTFAKISFVIASVVLDRRLSPNFRFMALNVDSTLLRLWYFRMYSSWFTFIRWNTFWNAPPAFPVVFLRKAG
jgi:hypothetical protein